MELQAALATFRASGNQRLEGDALNNLGIQHAAHGNHEEASLVYAEAIEVYESMCRGLEDRERITIFEQQSRTQAWFAHS